MQKTAEARTVRKITSNRNIDFPAVPAPKPRAYVREMAGSYDSLADSPVGTELSTHPEPLELETEPSFVLADGEPILIDDAHALFDNGEARLVDPDEFSADLDFIHTTPRDGDFVRVTPNAFGPLGTGTPGKVARLTASYLTACRSLAEKEWRARRAETVERYADVIDASGAPQYLTVAQVAAIFAVSEDTILRRAGKELPAAIKLGRQWRFKAAAIARFAA